MTVPVTVKVATAFCGKVKVDVLMLPDPDVAHVAPPEPTQLQVTPVRLTGKVSTNVGASADAIEFDPLLVTATV